MSNIERSLEYYFKDVNNTRLLGNDERDAFVRLEMLKQGVMDLTRDYPAIYQSMKIETRGRRSKKCENGEIIEYDCIRYVADGLERICSSGKADKDPLYDTLSGYGLNKRNIRSLQKKVKGAYLLAEAQKAMIVEANQRMVISIASYYFKKANGKLTPNDIIQEGNLGLIKAVEKFNYKMNFSFATYAKFWVHKTIWDSLYHNADIKLSRNISLERARFLEAKSEIEKQGRTANEHNIAEAAGISLKTAKKLFMGGRSLSLDQEMSTDPDMKDFKLGDTRGREDDTIGNIFAKQRRSKIEEALQVLDTRERTILKEIFGFDGCYSMTGPKATSELLDISTQAVNYTKLQALKKIASSQHAPMLRELLMDS